MLKTLMALCALGFAVAVQAGAQVPVKSFAAQTGQFLSAKISPNGDYLAVVLMKDGQRELGILDVKNLKISALLRFDRNEDVARYWWVSTTRVVVSIAQRFGPLDQPMLTGELYGIDADGTHKAYLFGYRGGGSFTHIAGAKAEPAFAWVADTLADDDEHILVAVNRWTNGEGADTSLYKLQVFNGGLSKIDSVPIPADVEYVADSHGLPRYASGLDLGGRVVQMVKAASGDKWLPVAQGEAVHDVELLQMSRDDQSVFLLSDQGTPHVCLREYALASNTLKTLSCAEDSDVDHVVFSLDDGRPVQVQGSDETQYLDGNSATSVFLKALVKSFPGQTLSITSKTADGRQILLQAQSDRVPGDFYLVDVEKKKAQFLFASHDAIDPNQMAAVKPVHYPTRDGATIHGYLTLPTGAEPKDLPLVMLPHGGPFGVHDEWAWDAWAQLLASRGYAVLQPNFRGSGGYGRAHQQAGYRKTATLMQDDLTDGVRWAIEQKIAAPDRICIVGESYGGYAAIMSAEREPALYRCAIAFAGIYDVASWIADADFAGSQLSRNFVARTWGDDAKALADASPVNHIDQLAIPVLIAHGTADERVPFSQAKALRKALDKARKPYEWLEFQDEVHGFIKDEDHERFLTAVLAFLDKSIGAGRAAKP
jgi:dipeptidyl aminopeptidase/acylaminoacyl peptidase